KSVIHMGTTSSTQIVAHQAAKTGAAHGTTDIEDEQRSGRGRMSRQWHTPRQKGAWLWLILRHTILPYLAPQLTLSQATVLAEVIQSFTKSRPQIKWTNDILIKGKKTAGILTEMQAEQDRIQYVVMGIGLNVNQTNDDFPKELEKTATSLKKETNRTWDIVALIQEIL